MAESLFSPNERKAITALARRHGFKSMREYLRSLVEVDAEKRGDPAPLEGDKLSDPAENFKRAWGEAMRGELLTEEEFWKAVSEDE